MRIALDAHRYTDFSCGDVETGRLLEDADRVYLPFVVVAELKAGFAVGQRRKENEALLQRFLEKPGVEILFADGWTLQSYALLYRQLRQQGTPIPTNDLWIAALVTQHNLALCTRDRHFERLPQLEIV
jgi:tRNA(fMet)-specific endonuclease VapC